MADDVVNPGNTEEEIVQNDPVVEETVGTEENGAIPGAVDEKQPVEEATVEETAPAVEELPPYAKEMQETIKGLQEQLKAKAETKTEAPQGQAQVTPEMMANIKRDFGFSTVKDPETGKESVSLNDEQFVNGILNMGRQIMAQAKEYVDQTVHGNVSDIRFEAVLADQERKTPDIRRFAPQIKEYLQKRYQPKDMSNPDFIMDGYYWAKGKLPLAPNAQAPKKNVRVIPPAPATRTGKPGVNGKPLSPLQQQMIKEGHFKNEAEIRAWDKADLNKL